MLLLIACVQLIGTISLRINRIIYITIIVQIKFFIFVLENMYIYAWVGSGDGVSGFKWRCENVLFFPIILKWSFYLRLQGWHLISHSVIKCMCEIGNKSLSCKFHLFYFFSWNQIFPFLVMNIEVISSFMIYHRICN